jgi:hypothetical protein
MKQMILKTKPNEFGWFIKAQYRKSCDDLIITLKNVDKGEPLGCHKRESYIDNDNMPEFMAFIDKIIRYRKGE